MTSPRFSTFRASPFLFLPCALLFASSAALAQTSPALPALPAPLQDAPPVTVPPPPPTPDAPNVGANVALPVPTREQLAPDTNLEPEPPPEPAKAGKVDGHSGFVLALSVGYAAAAGNSTGNPNDGLGQTFSGQIPLTAEIGANAIPSLFVGAYATYAPGGLGGPIATECTTDQLDCSAHSIHGGLAIRYRFLPGETVEPWIGYAVGYESNGFSATNSQTSAAVTGEVDGWEFARFSLGVDILAARELAFGPFVDVAFGQYGHMHLEQPNAPVQDGAISNPGVHEWITIGIRAVIMP